MPQLLATLAALVAVLGAVPPVLHRFEAVEPHMGTLVRITVYTTTADTARAAFRAAFDRIRDLDHTLSDYQADSELSQLTDRAVGRPVRVSDDLFTVLRASQALAEQTHGAFDVTQGPVIRLWREARKTGRLPDESALKEAGTRTGYRKLCLDARRHTVMVDTPGMALDVGAIGKGYAASEALRILEQRGIRSALVAVSGDLAFSGPPPGQRGWQIQIHSDDPTVVGIPAVLVLTHAAVSTSGSSEQHLDANNQRYSHVIDPASGMGLVDDLTVTVVAPHGLEADGLDTAASLLGARDGLALIESHREAAGVIIRRTGGHATSMMSTRFKALLTRQ